ncbi:MAG: type II secretion system protein GspM, partial [Gammaproteobacteria bacterium]
MREWWQGLTAREQGVLLTGGVALFAIALFLIVFEPLRIENERLQAQVTAEQGVLREMETLVAEVRQLGGNGPHSSALPAGQSLLAVLNAAAAGDGLADRIKRVVPNGEDEASIAFD